MLGMYEIEKELSVYVTTNDNVDTSSIQQRDRGDDRDEESEYSLSDDSYHSYYSSDDEFDVENSRMVTWENKSRTIKVNSTFANVVEFRRALAHYAIINEFAYYIEKSEPTRVTARCHDTGCKWRIHGRPIGAYRH